MAMEDDFIKTNLEALGLLGFEDELSQLGVTKVADLAYLEESDLLDINMNLVQARKLLKVTNDKECFQAQPAMLPSATGGSEAMPPDLNRSKSHDKRRKSSFWTAQSKRPRRLIFIRHGESEANVDRGITETVPDHILHLTARGRLQALEAGNRLVEVIGDETIKFVVSPYVRTKETLNGILHAFPKRGADLQIKEDVRIREQEYGNFDAANIKALHKDKKEFGAFYYRFPEGESPADCYDRASSFFESMYRAWEDNEHENLAVVCHGMMILVIMMRLFRIPISDFERLEALKNCEFIVLERPEDDAKYHIAYKWAAGEEKNYDGLRKDKGSWKPEPPVWNGDPDADLLTNKSAECS